MCHNLEIQALFSRDIMTATHYLNQLNQNYLATHKAKEDFFWDTYMGISDDHLHKPSGPSFLVLPSKLLLSKNTLMQSTRFKTLKKKRAR